MFAIGRLNGNNLHFASVDLTTSQLYTGMFHSLPHADLRRFVCHFRSSLFHCQSDFYRYML
jgi:hypothetical protein